MFTPENTAILRSLCDIADRARAEVRFGCHRRREFRVIWPVWNSWAESGAMRPLA